MLFNQNLFLKTYLLYCICAVVISITDFTGFNMTNTQKDHVASMERLAPELAALRARLCPDSMTEGSFYKIYFALLHPKLNEHDSELLSTQQVILRSYPP